MVRTFLFAIVLSGVAVAQPIGLGVKIGAPLTDAVDAVSSQNISTDTHRYVVGPYFELRLPLRFSVEVDALYRSYEYHVPGSPNISVGNWEFPVLAKYKLINTPIIKPYIEGGPVFSHVNISRNVSDLLHSSNYGIALGAGLDIHALVLHISPEVRYEGFAFRNISSPGELVQSNRNQVMFLVGIGF